MIFLGPPYKDSEKRPLAFATPSMARVAQAGLLAPKGWMMCQHHNKEVVSVPEGCEMTRREKIELHLSPREYCTDNAAMAAVGWELFEEGQLAPLDLDVVPGLVRK